MNTAPSSAPTANDTRREIHARRQRERQRRRGRGEDAAGERGDDDGGERGQGRSSGTVRRSAHATGLQYSKALHALREPRDERHAARCACRGDTSRSARRRVYVHHVPPATSSTPSAASRRRASAGRSASHLPSRSGAKCGAHAGSAHAIRVVHVGTDFERARVRWPGRSTPRGRGAATPIAATVASSTPAASPRQPACATADDGAGAIGEEHRQAVRGAHGQHDAGVRVTAASACGGERCASTCCVDVATRGRAPAQPHGRGQRGRARCDTPTTGSSRRGPSVHASQPPARRVAVARGEQRADARGPRHAGTIRSRSLHRAGAAPRSARRSPRAAATPTASPCA